MNLGAIRNYVTGDRLKKNCDLLIYTYYLKIFCSISHMQICFVSVK